MALTDRQTTPAGWYADPQARHQHRYWDGTAWTDHVADHGEPDVERLGGPPSAKRRRPILLVVAAAVVLLGAAAALVLRGGSDDGGGSSEEADVAASAARDLIGDDVEPLGAEVPTQIPSDFPLPDDAEVVAAFAASGSEQTVSATFATAAADPFAFVADGLEPAGYEMSGDMQFGTFFEATDADCVVSTTTFGFFQGSTFVGAIHVSEPGDASACRATITVAVGPDVDRSGQ